MVPSRDLQFIMIDCTDHVPQVSIWASAVTEQDPGEPDNCPEWGRNPRTCSSKGCAVRTAPCSTLKSLCPFQTSLILLPFFPPFIVTPPLTPPCFIFNAQPPEFQLPMSHTSLLDICLFFLVSQRPCPTSSLFPEFIFLFLQN